MVSNDWWLWPLMFGLFVGFLFVIYTPFKWVGCHSRYLDSDISYKYSFINGCMLKSNKWGWVPEDKFWNGDKHISLD